MAEVGLAELFTAINEAMLDAQAAVTRSTLDEYWRYFQPANALRRNDDEQANAMHEEAIAPVTRKIVIPYPDDRGVLKEINVPLVALVHHNTFNLDEVRLKMRIATSVDRPGGPLKVSLQPRRRAQDTAGKNDSLDTGGKIEEPGQEIELVFKRDAPPEGISRITNEAIKLL